jgi:ketosteroid isomerase-like protein
MTSFPLRPAAITIFVLSACNPPRSPADRDTTVSQSVNKEAEERAIRNQEQRWRAALTGKDSAAIGQFYTEAGYYLPQQSNGYGGRSAVSARWMGERNAGLTELERQPKKIEIADAGDMAYEVGTYDVKFNSKERGPGEATGNYVTVWKKVGGEWKTAAYIWNRGEGHE